MTRYVTLLRFTTQGVRNLKKSPARGLAFAKLAKKSGVKVETQLWTTGHRDGLLILTGDEKKILRCLALLAAQGNVRTESLRAFDAREFKSITA